MSGITSCPATLKYYDEEEQLAIVDDPQKYHDEIFWPEKVRLNLEYLRNRSFFGDLIIIFKTVFRRK